MMTRTIIFSLAILAPVAFARQGVGHRPRNAARAPVAPCYTFERGVTWVSCGGNTESVGVNGEMFVVAPDGRVAWVWTGTANGLVALTPPYSALGPLVETEASVASTCGTLVERLGQWDPGSGLVGRGAVDLLTGRGLKFDDYSTFFACSRDRRVVVGVTGSNVLRYRGKVMDRGVVVPDFAVSPAGRFIAWAGDCGVCVYAAASGRVSATRDMFFVSDVSDSGDAIGMDNSPTEDRIVHWHPGMAKPAVLVRDAGAPQWITPAVARALIARHRWELARRKRKGARK